MLIRRLLTYSILSLVALGGFFGSVHIETEKQSHGIVSVSYEGNGVYAFTDLQAAAGAVPGVAKDTDDDRLKPATNTTSADATKWANNAVDFLNFVLGVVTLVASPAILFAGWLMSPDWTSGDLFGLRIPMYSLWVTVSNIVYFVYAILLILIALGTMFGKESFSYKVMLPKLALGILMVPFTWWFVQWTISLSAVVTASVITIPMETISTDKNGWMSKPSIPTRVTINEDESGKDKTKTTKCSDAPSNCVSPTIFLRDQAGMYGYMMVYAYSVFKLDQIKDLSFDVDSVRKVGNVLNQLVMGMLMFLVFGLLTMALVAMLLVRAIKLWVYAIFSPLFTFQFVAGGAMKGVDNSDTFTIKEFVGLCFVPAIVALTLSFGLILINAISSDTPPAQKTCTDITTGCDIVRLMGSDKNKISRKVTGTGTGRFTTNTMVWGAMTIDFVGKAGAGQDAAAATETANGATSVLNSAGGIFGTLIIDIIALVFIWMAFMAAKNVSKAVSMAVEPFEKIGKQVGSLASSIPKYTPIPGLGMSANSMSKVVTNAENAMIGASDKKFKESAAGKLFGGDKVVAQVDEKMLAESIKKAGTSTTHPEWKNVGAIIEKQNGRDVEYSSIFKDLAGGLKEFKDRPEKIRALETAGYSNTNAQAIVDQLAKKGNEFDKNDTTLMTAFKSRIGSAAGGSTGSGTGSNFTQTKTDGPGGKVEFKVNIGGTTMTVDEKGKIAEGLDRLISDKKDIWTKDDFEKQLKDSAISSIIQKAILDELVGKKDFFKK